MTDLTINNADVSAKAFENDIQEYLSLEHELKRDFIKKALKVGEFLSQQRDKWKPERKWTTYVDKIGKTLTEVNQLIRVYEYSIENMQVLLDAGVNSWNKLNIFLTLPDSIKNKLAESFQGQEVTTSEMTQEVKKLKQEEGPDIADLTEYIDDDKLELELSTEPDELSSEEVIEDTKNYNIGFLADKMVASLKTKGLDVTPKSKPFAEVFLHLHTSIKKIEEISTKNLTADEKDLWTQNLKQQLAHLKSLKIK